MAFFLAFGELRVAVVQLPSQIRLDAQCENAAKPMVQLKVARASVQQNQQRLNQYSGPQG